MRNIGRFGRAEARRDDPARRRPDDGPADLHQRRAHRRLRRSDALDRDGKLDELLGGLMTRIALFQSQTGIDPAANAARLADAVARGGGGRRGDAVHAGNVRACSTATASARREQCPARGRRRGARRRARSGARARHLAPPRLARGAGRGTASSPIAASSSTARARSARATTRSICSTSTCRPARAGANSTSTRRASGAVLVNGTPVGKLGLTICYDLRFPALFARLAEADADVIAVPAAFTVPTGKAHWHVLLRARAIEAGLFVVAAAQAGRHEDGRQTFGHSLVVDPWGEVLLDMGEEPGVGFADIDLARIAEVRSRMPGAQPSPPDPRSGEPYDRLRSSMPSRRRDVRSLVPVERRLMTSRRAQRAGRNARICHSANVAEGADGAARAAGRRSVDASRSHAGRDAGGDAQGIPHGSATNSPRRRAQCTAAKIEPEQVHGNATHRASARRWSTTACRSRRCRCRCVPPNQVN